MGTSIQTVGARAELIKDGDVCVLIHLMLEQLRSDPTPYSLLMDMAEIWQGELLTSGPGTIDLRLDDIASEPEKVAGLEVLLRAVERSLSRFGETIPAETLNTRYRVPGVEFYDYSVQRISNAIGKLLHLLGALHDDGSAS